MHRRSLRISHEKKEKSRNEIGEEKDIPGISRGVSVSYDLIRLMRPVESGLSAQPEWSGKLVPSAWQEPRVPLMITGCQRRHPAGLFPEP